MILVVSLCAVPTTEISTNSLTFTCQPTLGNPTAGCVSGVSYGSTGTAYDMAAMPGMPHGASGGTIRLPVFWAGISSVSSGLINAMVSSLPQRAGLREVQSMMAAAKVSNPGLRNKVQRFTRECYLPAMNKMEGFLAGEGTSYTDNMRQAIENNALDAGRSLDYLGNKVLTNTMGLYAPCPHPDLCGATLKASAPVPGILGYGSSPGGGDDPALIPTCGEWWPELRQELLSEAAEQATGGTRTHGQFVQMLSDTIGGLASLAGYDSENIYEDLLVQRVSAEAVATASQRRDHAISSGLDTVYDYSIPGLVGGMFTGRTQAEAKSMALSTGLMSEKFSLTMKMPLIMKAAPLVQSILIMVIIALTPVVLVIGRYSLGTLVACGVGYFTVRFWTFLWALATWADELLTSLFAGNQAMNAAGAFGPNDASMTFASYALEMTDYQMSSVVQLTTAALFIGMPMIFSMLMGWAGVIGISGLNEGMRGMSASTENAGSRADQGARAAAAAAAGAAIGVGGSAVAASAGAGANVVRGVTGAVQSTVVSTIRGR